MELLDLQKQLGEEKRAHGETIFRYLSAQTHAQTAEAQAAKAQELVAETTLKLDQAREEIRGLRDQTQDAQAKITDLEAQMAQMKIVEQSQTAIEAQAQELETAQSKIASLEALVAKARAVFAESEVETNPEPRDQAEEFKAKIKDLEAQMAQMKVVEQFQAQSQELKAAQENITKLEAHNQELSVAQAQVKELETRLAQSQNEARSLGAFAAAQTQELLAAQSRIKDLEAKIQSKPKAPVLVPFKPSWRPRDLSWLENSYCLDADGVNFSSAPWFGPNHLKHFVGQILRLGKSGLKGEDIVQFLDSWLAGAYPDLEMFVLNDFQAKPTAFDKFASNLVRLYSDDDLSRTSTFHFERPSDSRIACVKITRDMFIFFL